MMKTTLLTLTAVTGVLALAPLNAQAQATFGSYDPSVTIYSLDGPPEPINLIQPPPRTKPASATDTAPAQTTAEETAVANTANQDLGLWGAKWSGRANIGASLQTGNTEQDAINADAELKARWPDVNGDPLHRATLKAEFNRENEDDERTEDNKSIDAAYDYFFAEKWFLNSTLGFEQDDIDELDLRTTAGLGLGHQPFEGDDLNLQYVFGPSYLREEFESGNTDDSIAARWALEYDQRVWDDVLQLFHNHELLVPADETDSYIFDSKTGVRVPLKKGLVATGEIDFERDNAPEPGVEKDDTTYAIKLGYEW